MKACWTEGELRAYLDRELPANDRDSVAAHLAECGECDLRYREIAKEFPGDPVACEQVKRLGGT